MSRCSTTVLQQIFLLYSFQKYQLNVGLYENYKTSTCYINNLYYRNKQQVLSCLQSNFCYGDHWTSNYSLSYSSQECYSGFKISTASSCSLNQMAKSPVVSRSTMSGLLPLLVWDHGLHPFSKQHNTNLRLFQLHTWTLSSSN